MLFFKRKKGKKISVELNIFIDHVQSSTQNLVWLVFLRVAQLVCLRSHMALHTGITPIGVWDLGDQIQISTYKHIPSCTYSTHLPAVISLSSYTNTFKDDTIFRNFE